jgi:hypothetical protein
LGRDIQEPSLVSPTCSCRRKLASLNPHAFVSHLSAFVRGELERTKIFHCVGEAGARDFVSQKLAKEDTARISKLRRLIMITAILAALAIVAIRLAGATVNEAVLGTVGEGRNRICDLHIDTKGELQC